jgi:hypothetical protein
VSIRLDTACLAEGYLLDSKDLDVIVGLYSNGPSE